MKKCLGSLGVTVSILALGLSAHAETDRVISFRVPLSIQHVDPASKVALRCYVGYDNEVLSSQPSENVSIKDDGSFKGTINMDVTIPAKNLARATQVNIWGCWLWVNNGQGWSGQNIKSVSGGDRGGGAHVGGKLF